MASAQDIKPPLTLEELATLFRLDVDDLPGDTVTDVNWKNDDTGLLWKNQEICRYAVEAQNEFCFRNPILDQDTQAAVTQITVSASTGVYAYDSRILSIRRMKFVDSNNDEFPVLKRSTAWMDRHAPGSVHSGSRWRAGCRLSVRRSAALTASGRAGLQGQGEVRRMRH